MHAEPNAPSALDAVAYLERTSHARAFAPGPLPPMALRRIVDAGRLAPSLFNTQPVRFIVVREPAKYTKMRAAANKARDTFFKGYGFFATVNKRLKQPQYAAGLDRQRTGEVLPENGVLIVVLEDDRYPEAAEACSCALMSMTLEATACGVASAFTSWTRGFGFQKDTLAFLGVPKGFKVFTSLVVGNPVTPLAPARKDRRSLDDAVTWM
jgi:nitroreductase